MKTRIRKLTPSERKGELAGVFAVVEPLWEGDEIDYFQWARDGGIRVQIPTDLLSERARGVRLYGPPRVLELRTPGETVVNPFLLKIYIYTEDEEVWRRAEERFARAVNNAYSERKGMDFAQPPWRWPGRNYWLEEVS